MIHPHSPDQRRRSKVPVVWRRFPILGRFRPSVGSLLPQDLETAYPLLGERIAFAREVIGPAFDAADGWSQIAQNRQRRQQVGVIASALLATVFAAAQASFTSAVWIGVVVAGLAAAGSAMTTFIRQDEALGDYVTQRRRAERLRSLCFTFLCGAPAPGQDGDLERHDLRVRVAEICHPGS
jgi:SMODS and SLOG-associating 2TM effector domain 3